MGKFLIAQVVASDAVRYNQSEQIYDNTMSKLFHLLWEHYSIRSYLVRFPSVEGLCGID